MRKLILITTMAMALAMCNLPSVNADVPHLISYQGRLTDAAGIPIEGSRSITFRIYDAFAGGNLLWQETHSNVTVTDGIFDVLLGSITALNLPFDIQYYLAIQVGSDPEMTPRQQIASVGYAYKAEQADSATNATAATNADTVDGIHASTTPEVNKLVALNANSEFPASVTPSDIRIKGWVNFDGRGGAFIQNSYNVSSVTRNSQGDYTITWDTPFANTNYCVVGMVHDRNIAILSMNAGSVQIKVHDRNFEKRDESHICVMAIGDQ